MKFEVSIIVLFQLAVLRKGKEKKKAEDLNENASEHRVYMDVK